MFKNEAIFIKAILTAKNHIARVEEGSLLLASNRSLAEMTTPITGLTAEETLERRNDFLEFINQMDEAGIQKHLAMVEHQIEVALDRSVQGTSELYWQRIVILDRLIALSKQNDDFDIGRENLAPTTCHSREGGSPY